MATSLFLRDDAQSATVPSNWTTAGIILKLLGLTRGGGVASSGATATTASIGAALTNGSLVEAWPGVVEALPTSGTSNAGAAWYAWTSNPLNAVTIAGSITVNLRALESSTMANYGVGAEVYRLAGGVLTRIGINNNTTELGTSEAARSFTITPTSTALADGDRLVVVPFFLAVGGSASGGFTSNCFWNGTASGASGDTFVTFTESITEAVAGSTYTKAGHGVEHG